MVVDGWIVGGREGGAEPPTLGGEKNSLERKRIHLY